MPTSDVKANDLWPAICDLTNPQREELKRKPGNDDREWADIPNLERRTDTTLEYVSLPSLWAQLLAADARNGGSGSSKPGSRPPISVEVVVLVDEIRATTARKLVEANRRYIKEQERLHPHTCAVPLKDPSGDIPKDLRRLSMRYRTDPVRAAAMADTVRKWVGATVDALGLVRPKVSYIRVPCMVCRATMIPEQLPGEPEPKMRPVLKLIWQGEQARATECRACGDTRWPGDFHELAENAIEMSKHRQTLASTAEGTGW